MEKRSILIIGLFLIIVLIGISSASQISYLNMDEGSGNMTYDSKGLANVSLFNSAWVTGKYSNGLSFSGGGYGNFTPSTINQFNVSNFTVEMWVKLNANQGTLFAHVISGNGILLQYSGTNLRCYLGDGGFTNYATFSNPPLNTWFHYACSYNGTGITVFYNGSYQSSTNVITDITYNNVKTYLGYDGSTSVMDGNMDEFQFWDEARNSTQILQDLGSPNTIYLILNQTIPKYPVLNSQNVYINVSLNDTQLRNITYINFTLVHPNGSYIFNNQLGTLIGELPSIEEWHSQLFNISFNTTSLGTWKWNYTATNDLDYKIENSGQFIINDSIYPNINITYPLNNSIYYQNISIDLNISASENLEVSRCWYSTDNGITNLTISNCLNNQSIKLYLTNATYNFTVSINDTWNNYYSWKFFNISIQYDNIKPSIKINSPSGTLTSKTISISVNSSDLGGLSYCYYNITRGASSERQNTQFNCSSTSYIVSSDNTDYVINVFANDTTGNSNYTNSSFSVSTGGSGGTTTGGGGGGTTTVSSTLSQNFSIVSTSFGNTLDVGLAKGSVKARTKDFYGINKGTEFIELDLTCDDTGTNNSIENFCQYVKFENNSIILSPNEALTTQSSIFIITPPNSDYGDNFYFNIVAYNKDKSQYSKISVTAHVDRISTVFYKWSYLGKTFAYPVLLISFLSASLIFILIFSIGIKYNYALTGVITSILLFFTTFLLVAFLL